MFSAFTDEELVRQYRNRVEQARAIRAELVARGYTLKLRGLPVKPPIPWDQFAFTKVEAKQVVKTVTELQTKRIEL